LRSKDGDTAVTQNVSMNADLPLIDIGTKLIDIDREVSGYSELTNQRSDAIIAELDTVIAAYVTLTSSHLDQLRHACQLSGDGYDVIRLVWLSIAVKTFFFRFK